MGTPVPAAHHALLGTSKRLIFALAILAVALAAAIITTVAMLQSDTTAPSVVDPGVNQPAPDWLQNYQFGSADGLSRATG
jgi:type IV secretory pathway component VirB8